MSFVSTFARSTCVGSLSFACALVVCSAITAASEPPESPAAAPPAATADASAAAPPAVTSADTRDDARREVDLDFSTEPMPRNASLAVAGSEAASRALELAAKPLLGGVLARRNGWGIASRAAWVLWIDMPLGSLGHTLNHEYGHLARLPDDAERGRVEPARLLAAPHLRGLGQPRSSRIGSRRGSSWRSRAGAGRPTSSPSCARGTCSMPARGRTTSTPSSYSVSKLERTQYLLEGTRESLLDPQTEEDWHWDPLLYARWLSEIEEGPDYSRAAFQERARSLRRGAYWNLVDYTLWAATVGWIKGYVVKGEHSLPSPWLRIGPIGVAPSLAFTLTPIGPERTVLTGLQLGRRSADIHVRWTDPVAGAPSRRRGRCRSSRVREAAPADHGRRVAQSVRDARRPHRAGRRVAAFAGEPPRPALVTGRQVARLPDRLPGCARCLRLGGAEGAVLSPLPAPLVFRRGIVAGRGVYPRRCDAETCGGPRCPPRSVVRPPCLPSYRPSSWRSRRWRRRRAHASPRARRRGRRAHGLGYDRPPGGRAEARGGVPRRRRAARGRARGRRRGGVDPCAHPAGPAPERAARLRDLGPLPEGRGVAQGAPCTAPPSSSSTPARSSTTRTPTRGRSGSASVSSRGRRSTSRPGRSTRSPRRRCARTRTSGSSVRRSAPCPWAGSRRICRRAATPRTSAARCATP